MKKFSVLCVLVLLIFSSIMHGQSKEIDESQNELNQMADQALQLVKQQKYAEAKTVIERFSDRFLKKISEKHWSIKEITPIIHTYDQAREAVTKVTMEHEQRVHQLTKFRLAVDTLISHHQPLWNETKTVVMSPLEESLEALQEQNQQQFDHYVNEFLSKYDLIRPSLIIDLSETEMQKLESYVQYLDQQRNELFTQPKSVNQLRDIIEVFHALYEPNNDDTFSYSLIEVIGIVGSIIIVTFIYVGWRKYKGEKEKQKARNHKQREL